MDALLVGVTAGLAVAVPLGAIGTLVIDLGLRHGPRPALAAGMGVATVDGLYATAAALFGASLSAALAPAQHTIRLIAAAVLAVVALLLVRAALRRPDRAAPALPSHGRTYARFVALTSVNPTTAATFAAVAAGLKGGAPVAFVAGAFAASAAWHIVLATGAGLAGRRLSASAALWTSLAGAGLALALAVRFALSA